MKQDAEVKKAANAVRDLYRAVKNMDEQHQRQVIWASLSVFAEEPGWDTTAV